MKTYVPDSDNWKAMLSQMSEFSSVLIRVTRPSLLNHRSSTNCEKASEAINARKVGEKK
jgi:hypothetical protein